MNETSDRRGPERNLMDEVRKSRIAEIAATREVAAKDGANAIAKAAVRFLDAIDGQRLFGTAWGGGRIPGGGPSMAEARADLERLLRAGGWIVDG